MEVMDPGLVLEGFLTDPTKRMPLVIHGILWGFTNSQATQGDNVFTLLRILVIIPILESLRKDLNYRWFILC